MRSGILRCYIGTLKLRASAPFPSHVARMAQAVEVNVELDPVEVGFLGSAGVMQHADALAHLVKQARCLRRVAFDRCDCRAAFEDFSHGAGLR